MVKLYFGLSCSVRGQQQEVKQVESGQNLFESFLFLELYPFKKHKLHNQELSRKMDTNMFASFSIYLCCNTGSVLSP